MADHAAQGLPPGDRQAAAAEGPAMAGASATDARPASMVNELQALWGLLPKLISDRVELLSLEMHRAGLALVQITMLVVAIAILGVTAWLVLWGGIVAGLVALGLHLALAFLVALTVNLGAVALAVVQVRRQLLLLNLPATRRHLMINSTPGPLQPGRNDAAEHDERPNPHATRQPVAS